MSIDSQQMAADAALFGNRFVTQEVPSREFPDTGMFAQDAFHLVAEDLALEGDPARNLATFVTTWMEPEAQQIIPANLHRNFIDHAEYPCTAEIEQRCIRMLADLFHAPGETTGARTQGSSEAIMLGTTFTGHKDDVVGINHPLLRIKAERGLDVPMHVDAASGGFVWPFLYPHSEWDFLLEQVRSINVSGHKFGLVYPGIGWLILRETADLAKELVFEENYLGKTDSTFTLNFSTGSAMVLAQYYNFVRYGRAGYT